jgi:hypothetical protein
LVCDSAVYTCNLLGVPTDAERAVSLLTYASHTKVANALQVSKTTVGKWAKGRVTPYRLNQLEQLLRPDLEMQKAAPPGWAERLLESLFVWEKRAEVTDAELAEAEARVAAFLAVTRQRRRSPGGASGGGAVTK